MIPPLFEHQKVSKRFMKANPRVLDFSDPGTGKTRVQIEVIVDRLKREPGKVLIIAPKSLLVPAWKADFEKFAPHLLVSVATAANRKEAFEAKADVYVTNTDAAKWLAAQRPSFFKQFHTLVIDEISMFKHRTSDRSKAIGKIKKHFKYRYGLTGTPISNGITNIWNIVNIIDDGAHLGTSFVRFRNETQVSKQVGANPNMLNWVDKEGIHDVVSGLIEEIVVRHKFEECLDVPANFEYQVPYTMPPVQRKAYTQMQKHAMTVVSGDLISAQQASVVATKLLQIASGAVYTDTDYKDINKERYELIRQLVEERAHSIVFFLWQHQRDNLIAEFEKAGITYACIDGTTPDNMRSLIVEAYQNGQYQVLLAHPQSTAHGLTLTRGTTTIWASPTLNLEFWLQGNRRIYRAGQTQKTETIVIVAKDTIEEQAVVKLMAKNAKQMSVLDFLQESFKLLKDVI